MKYFKATIQYDGTHYFGWQKQPDQRTVQGTLEAVLAKLTNGDNSQVIGSGRTDAGVHAFGQVIRIACEAKMSCDDLGRAMNSLLPDDINISKIEESSDNFQPVFNAKKKEYRYYFSLNMKDSPFMLENYQRLRGDYDIERLKEACALFIGRHDFKNFCTTGTPVKSTIREVFECSLERVDFDDDHMMPEGLYYIRIIGEGFLKQMVRLVVATIWSYSQGKINREQIIDAFDADLDNKLAPTAPARGLYLYKVTY